MAWGAIIGAGLGMGGSAIQGNANDKQLRNQATLERRYEGAANQIGQWDQEGEKSLASDLARLSGERYGDYGSLAATLGSSARGDAINGGRSDFNSRLSSALGITGANTQTAAPAWTGGNTGSWYGRAMANYEPAFQANKTLAVDNAGQMAGSNYDQAAYRKLREQQTDIGRRAGEAQQREGLMQAGRQRMLQDAGVKYRWKGPSSGYYNSQLLGQGLQLAGSGVQSYAGYQQSQQPGTYSNSPYATNRLQGPSNG